ncbi:MAG TPA: cation diffusion facilitator family transporter [Burkholderiales bacterium]
MMPLERFAWLSIGAALATILLKAAAWWITGSVGLLSDALESLVNLAAALLALWMLRLAAAPPDEEYPYGFSKAEYFSAGIEGALIVLAATGIVVAAAPRFFEPRPLDMPALGLALTALATAINFGVARALIGVGRRAHSITLEADGRHLMADVWTSLGVLAGVAVVLATDLYWLDPLIALAVAAHIVWAGARLMRRSIKGLLDAAIAPTHKQEVVRLFEEYSRRHGVTFHALRTRQAGARRFLSFHMLVPDAWTVLQAHNLSEELEERIRALVPNASIDTHIEPISDPVSYQDQELDRR